MRKLQKKKRYKKWSKKFHHEFDAETRKRLREILDKAKRKMDLLEQIENLDNGRG